VPEDTPTPLLARRARPRLRQVPKTGSLTDAFASDALVPVVLACLREGMTLATEEGESRFRPTERLASLDLLAEAETRRLSAEQSNSTRIQGKTVVLTLLRQLAPGVHPEAAMTGHLTEAGYEGAPPLPGELRAVLAGMAVREAVGPFVAGLHATANRLRRTVPWLAQKAAGALKTRHHGGSHLGQVLIARGDAVIGNFESVPTRTVTARRVKASALRDAAGLLRCSDHTAAVRTRPEMTPAALAGPVQRRAALVTAWGETASPVLLDAQRIFLAAAAQRFVAPAGEAALLNLFLVPNEACGVRSEAANRPKWLPVSLRGLLSLAARMPP
jgi:predicted trehalose synthase